MRTKIIILSLGLFSFAMGCSDSCPTPADATGTIDATGGTLAVTEGPLTGAAMTLPANAVAVPTIFEIRQSTASVINGALVIGPASLFSPSSTLLALPANLTLTFDPMLVPTEVMPADFRVPYRDPTGALKVATPATVDTTAGRVTLDTGVLGTFWVAVPNIVRFRDYLPLNAGDTYSYQSGLSLQISRTTSEPNFIGVPIIKLQYSAGTVQFFGDYFSEGMSGELFFKGEFDISVENIQERVDGDPLFFDMNETVGVPRLANFTFVGFRPYGISFASYVGSSASETLVSGRTGLTTPAGAFNDVIVVEWDNNRNDSRPRSERRISTTWLARGVGPVQIRFDDGRLETLVSATVGGMMIP